MSSYLPEGGWKRVLVLCLYALLLAGAVFLFFRFLFGAILPFLLAWAAVLCLRPVILFLERRAKVSERAAGFASVLALLLLIGVLCRFLLVRLYSEASRFAGEAGEYLSDFFVFLDRFLSRLPLPEGLDTEAFKGSLGTALSGFLSPLTSAVPEGLLRLVSSLPGILLFLVAFIVSAFYLGMEYSSLRARLISVLPEKWKKRLRPLRAQMLLTAGCYLRAYLIMTVITFAELLIGFLLLGVEYAVLAAALTAIVDLLPVLGVGTVLLPWAVICFLRRELRLGIGLLIIWGVCLVMRQLTEPRVVGTSVGLHPLLTLVAMYVGYSLAGVWGLILLPFATVIALKSRKGKENLPGKRKKTGLFRSGVVK